MKPNDLLYVVCHNSQEVVWCLQRRVKFVFSPTMTRLDLFNKSIGDAEVELLSDAFERTTSTSSVFRPSSILSIDFTANRIGPSGAKRLARMLAVNTTIESIIFSANNLGDEGLVELSKCLAANTTLKHLGFWNNHIQNKGAQALLDAMRVSISLTLFLILIFILIKTSESKS
eukprot:TRINITY_DN4647_c0_g3_i1.p1 TRINITY_DN4647_c0_g3~~TRINITY_DN4647_c0_g3_i1.p1  ORF type:complete len:173 (-),score=35.97 TRINITY_DN4647_c0_g3_i1:348-866(-)